MAMNIPAGYKSPDVIDRRNGQKPTLSDKIRDLSVSVQRDYRDSGTPAPDSPFGPSATDTTPSGSSSSTLQQTIRKLPAPRR